MGKVAPPPWPSTSVGRLVWYVTTEGVELWLPTGAEEREVYEEAEEAKPKQQRMIAPTFERPRSPQRPNLNARPAGTEPSSRIRIPSE